MKCINCKRTIPKIIEEQHWIIVDDPITREYKQVCSFMCGLKYRKNRWVEQDKLEEKCNKRKQKKTN